MSAARVEHGTPEGYARGCTKHEKCPALTVHGLTCFTAHARFESGERRYMAAYARDRRAAAIAKRLGLRPAFAVDQTAAGTPAIEEETPTHTEPAVEAEEMGHPTPETTPETEPTMDETPTPTPTTPSTKPTRSPADAAAASRERKAQKDRQNAIATVEGRAEVRAWAKRNGHDVATQGRIPAAIVYAFVDAGGKDISPPEGIEDAPTGADTSQNDTTIHVTAEEWDEALAGARKRAELPEPEISVDEDERPEWAVVAAAADPEKLLELLSDVTAQRDQARSLAARLMLEVTTIETREAQGLAFLLGKNAELRDLADQLFEARTERDALQLALANTRLQANLLSAALDPVHRDAVHRDAAVAARTRRGLFGRRSAR